MLVLVGGILAAKCEYDKALNICHIVYFNILYRASFIILNYDQLMHNYFTNFRAPTCFDTIVSSSGSF